MMRALRRGNRFELDLIHEKTMHVSTCTALVATCCAHIHSPSNEQNPDLTACWNLLGLLVRFVSVSPTYGVALFIRLPRSLFVEV